MRLGNQRYQPSTSHHTARKRERQPPFNSMPCGGSVRTPMWAQKSEWSWPARHRRFGCSKVTRKVEGSEGVSCERKCTTRTCSEQQTHNLFQEAQEKAWARREVSRTALLGAGIRRNNTCGTQRKLSDGATRLESEVLRYFFPRTTKERGLWEAKALAER